ncbi:MAG: ABC transporter ATP-binding protein [Acidobacteriia bacterium]|nr:ABC transporter ATP-binding protein [Terriglobia bacterium]
MIEVDHISKRYGSKDAVIDVSFAVKDGEILGFLGPNAAGKTTTMRILTGYIPPTAGTARIEGLDILTQSLDTRRLIGYLPENPPLYGEMTVESYLHFVAKIKGISSADRPRKVEEILVKCRLVDASQEGGDYRRRLIKHLSKGYRQRVGLAQALIHDPKILILDEPTVGLDPKQIIEVRELIKNLAGTHTVILSTHILPEVSMTCHRVVIINKGRIVAEDTPENLTLQLHGGDRLIVEIKGQLEAVKSRIQALPGVLEMASKPLNGGGAHELTLEVSTDRSVRNAVARAVLESGAELWSLRPVSMSLEDIFLQLTTSEQEIEGAPETPTTATPATDGADAPES